MLGVGDTVERWRIEAILGHGGMATVYRVRHVTLDSQMALKVLRTHREDVCARLIEEGRTQARLKHPNLLSVLDVFETGDGPALLLDLVEGPTLTRWAVEGDRTLNQIEGVFRRIVDAVGHAHAHDVVHRDLKPDNVLMERDQPRVTDFGIAKYLADSMADTLTREGAMLGTPAYMAPEQMQDSKRVDHRADVYSLGVLLYELITGQRPYDGASVVEIFQAIMRAEHLPIHVLRPETPSHLIAACESCLHADRQARPATCEALLHILDGRTTPKIPAPATFATVDRAPPDDRLVPRAAPIKVAGPTSLAVNSRWASVPRPLRIPVYFTVWMVVIGTVFYALGGLVFGQPPSMLALLAVGFFSCIVGFLLTSLFQVVLAVMGVQVGYVPPAQREGPGALRRRWRALPRGWRAFLGGSAGVAVPSFVLTWPIIALELGLAATLLLTPKLVGFFGIAGLLFGLVMSLIGGLGHVLGITEQGKRRLQRMSPEQRFRAVFGGTPDEVFCAAEEAMSLLSVAGVLVFDPEERTLVVETAVGQSLGEIVTVQVEVEDGCTVAEIASRSVLPTVVFDGGRNRRIVQQIADALVDAFPVEL